MIASQNKGFILCGLPDNVSDNTRKKAEMYEFKYGYLYSPFKSSQVFEILREHNAFINPSSLSFTSRQILIFLF